MSYKVVARVLEHSASTGSERLALVALAESAHEDGMMADPRLGVDDLAERAGVHRRSYQRALAALCAAGEIVMFRGVGRGRTSIFGVLVGLSEAARHDVYRCVWLRAAVFGGAYQVADQETAEEDPKGWRGVTLYTGRKGGISSRKGGSLPPLFSYREFVFPVSRVQQQQAGPDGDGEDRTPPLIEMPAPRRDMPAGLPFAGVLPSPALAARLKGIGVYDHAAAELASLPERAWVEEVLGYVAELVRRGECPAPGGLVVRLVRKGGPLPAIAASARRATSATEAPEPRSEMPVRVVTDADRAALSRRNAAMAAEALAEALEARPGVPS